MGQVACGMVWRCPGGRARPLLPLALEAKQARYTNPHQGRGPQFLKSSDVQRAPVCLGRGLCPLDHSRSASGDPAMGPGGVSDAAALEAVGPTPLFVVAEASSNESGLVEPRRDLSPGCRGARRHKCGGAAETETPRDASQGCPCPSQSRWCVRFKDPFDDRDPQTKSQFAWAGPVGSAESSEPTPRSMSLSDCRTGDLSAKRPSEPTARSGWPGCPPPIARLRRPGVTLLCSTGSSTRASRPSELWRPTRSQPTRDRPCSSPSSPPGAGRRPAQRSSTRSSCRTSRGGYVPGMTAATTATRIQPGQRCCRTSCGPGTQLRWVRSCPLSRSRLARPSDHPHRR